MRRLWILPLTWLLFIAPAFSMQITWKERIKLRQSVLDRNAVEKPALIQITFPKDKPASYAVDAGLTLNLISEDSKLSSSLKMGPTVELHRSTQGDKPQASFSAGATALHIKRMTDASDFVSVVTAGYKRDKIKHTSTMQTGYKYTPLISKYAIGLYRGPDALQVLWQPTFGLEYDNVIESTASMGKGSTLRGHAQVDVAVYPAGKALERRLELATSYIYWPDLAEAKSVDDGKDRHELLQSSLTVYLDGKRHFGVGFDYVHGENPTKGLDYQTYALLSLKLKF
jgi:hypothetical protein